MTEQVAVLYDAWGNRASAIEPEHIVNGERVFRVGSYSITVPNDHSQPAKVVHRYNRWGASENPMPNMSFSDGEMRIPVEDFADLILRRVPADELAEGLWRDDEVRARFVECMADRYAGSIEDSDRRELLDRIQVQIHAKAIDRAIERLNNVESELRARSNRSRWEALTQGHYDGLYERYKTTLFEMREKGLLDDEQIDRRLNAHTPPERLKEFFEPDPVTKESVGPSWSESRDFWRARLEECFPEPVVTAESEEGAA